MSMDEFYRHFRWWMEPDDERAVKRFHAIFEFFKGRGKASSVLDLCAGTGIAGVAAAKALSASNLTLVEAREKDLVRVVEWVEREGLQLSLNPVVGDVLKLPSLVEEHEVALLFGHSMPHFDPFQAVKLFAGVALVLSDTGRFFVEETDRIYRFLYRSVYQPFRVEARGEGYSIISLYEGYDVERGMEKRGYYKVPGFEKILEIEVRPWDVASQLAIGRIFFEDVNMVTPEEHGIEGVSTVLLFSKPRKSVAGMLYNQF
ncbi:SAM-dependent methyltransferase [Thermococcus siculi]|uniref:SAM-dependent methyltransferase n=1 Tax=Thermococcus siculi TaxID=72803 RepID=A0A2Z2MQ45_9EURY|nr:class I SAM-dependent methyltransferase [Thermococcus siculi]ASJ08784.1 SAM-dependent methyltransferase [Thermococcus siculi]